MARINNIFLRRTHIMKFTKKIASLVLTAALVLGTSVTAFAATNSDVIQALKDANVPATYIIQAENYLKTKTLTTEEVTAVKAQLAVAEKVMTDAGTKDVSTLTQAQKDKVLVAITEAGKAIDLTVSVTKQSSGKFEIVAKDVNGTTVISFTSNEVKQTGMNTTIIYVGALMMVLAAGSVLAIGRLKSSNINA
jgi:hypothetical protein